VIRGKQQKEPFMTLKLMMKNGKASLRPICDACNGQIELSDDCNVSWNEDGLDREPRVFHKKCDDPDAFMCWYPYELVMEQIMKRWKKEIRESDARAEKRGRKHWLKKQGA
jgi:hypothetical protein